jgi:hypothetical protein
VETVLIADFAAALDQFVTVAGRPSCPDGASEQADYLESWEGQALEFEKCWQR